MPAKYDNQLRQTLGDWESHIMGTVLFFDNDRGHTCPLYVEDIRCPLDRDDQVYLSDLALEGPAFLFGDDSLSRMSIDGDQMRMGFPTLGFADNMGSSYLRQYSYSSRRQFRKSLNGNVVQSFIPHQRLVASITNAKNRLRHNRRDRENACSLGGVNLQSVSQIMNNAYDTVDEAVSSVVNGESVSRALSRNFGVSATMYADKPVIVYNGVDVGYFGEVATIHASFAEVVQAFEEQVTTEVKISE